MNLVEAALDVGRLLQAYTGALNEKVSSGRFPSPDLLSRLASLV